MARETTFNRSVRSLGLAAALVLLAAPLAAQPRAAPVRLGELTEGDLTLSDFRGPRGPEDHYVISGMPGQTIAICSESFDFDTNVRFGTWRDGEFTLIAEDDIGGMGWNAWLITRMDDAGEHHVIVHADANTLDADSTGEYILRVMRGPVGQDLDPERRGCAEGGRAEYGSAATISWRDAMEPITTGEPWRRALGPDSEADASGARYYDFSYQARAGERLVITATSEAYDPSLSIGTGADAQFAALRTVPGRNGRAVLEIQLPRGGEHVIRISTRGAAQAGSFWVQVDTDAPGAQP